MPLIKNLLDIYDNKDILITCGSDARIEINEVLKNNNINGIDTKTLMQKDFLKCVINSELFITSPGMTTIYETYKYDKDTILLPPQNLSQYYNVDFAKKLIKRVKLITWKKKELTLEHLKQYFTFGEDYVVDIIYKNINDASKDIKYNNDINKQIKDILERKFIDGEVISFEENGTETIVKEIKKWNQ